MKVFGFYRQSRPPVPLLNSAPWLLLMAVLACPTAVAEQLGAQGQIHGFVSQALLTSTDNNMFGESDDEVSVDFSELGFNGSYRVQPDLLVAGQLLSRRAGKLDDGDIKVDYALVDYMLSSRDNYNLGLRLGRVKNAFGIYNDTRDVAFTRSSIILPQSIYFDRARDVALSSDGLYLNGSYRWGRHELTLESGAAQPRVENRNTEILLLGENRPGRFSAETSYLNRLTYLGDGGKTRLSISNINLNMTYLPAAAESATTGSIRFAPKYLSAQYLADTWSLTGEYGKRYFYFHSMAAYIPFTKVVGESYYLQGSKRLNMRWQLLLRYDVLFQNEKDKSGREFENLTRGTRPAHTQFARDTTLGLQWDISSQWMGRIEYHRVNGTAWLPSQDNPDVLRLKQRWSLFAMQLSYRF